MASRRQLPSRELSGILQAVPATPTSFNSVTTFIEKIYFNNTTAGALTISVLDKQGVPVQLIGPAVSLAANQDVLFNFGESCQIMPGGITWSASGAGITGSIFGYIVG